MMHAIAHADCTNTVRESALEVNSGRKIFCRKGDSNLRRYYARHFSRTLYQLNYPRTVCTGLDQNLRKRSLLKQVNADLSPKKLWPSIEIPAGSVLLLDWFRGECVPEDVLAEPYVSGGSCCC